MNEAEQSKCRTAFYLLIALVLLGAAGYGIYETFRAAPTVAGPLVTAFGAVVAVLIGRQWEQRQQIEQARRERVSEGYTTLIEAFFNVVQSRSEGPEEMTRAMQQVVQAVLLWGPPSVIRDYNKWRKALAGTSDDGLDGLLPFEALMRAMRDDMGSKNDGLEKGDLLRLFINDFDEHFQARIAGAS